MLIAYILTGLLFLLLPGTFLGVWNLISISSRHALDSLSPAWIQAHGHAQIFGWIGTFILGIGFYSLTKMGRLPAFAVPRGWTCFGLWTAGITLRWFEGVVGWQWRVLLPLSALLELAAFLLFFRTVSSHRPSAPVGEGTTTQRRPEPWMLMVIGSTLGFLVTLVMNFAATLQVSISNTGPALAHVADQRLVTLATWGFLVPAVWGFNARWLPVFLGLDQPRARFLFLVPWPRLGSDSGGVRRPAYLVRGPTPVRSAVRRVRTAHCRALGPACQDDWCASELSVLCTTGIRVVADRGGSVRTRLLERCEWRHLGRVAARPHRGIPFDHGVRDRPADSASLLRCARPVQPPPDAGFAGGAHHWLRAARGL